MAKKKPKKAVFLLPLTYNDGSRIPKETIDNILAELFFVFDGWTVESEVKGAYRMHSGEERVEKLLRVAVLLQRDEVAGLRRMVGRWAAQLGQEAMYFEISDSQIEFIRPSRKEP